MKTSALAYAIPTRKFPSIKEYEIKKNNEPIVSLKVTVPDEYTGDVMGDLNNVVDGYLV